MARQFQYQTRFEPLGDLNLTTPTFFQGLFPDELRSLKRFPESDIELLGPPEFDGYFGAVYPDSIRTKNLLQESRGFNTPLVVAPPLTLKNFDAIYPDQFFRRKDHSNIPSIFALNRTITIPGAASNLSLIWFYNLRVRLDVKKAVDSGNILADASDVLGTPVTFNKAFKDIDSLTATVQETAEFTVVIDFVDVPNPTSFNVFVFDSAGVRATKTVYWKARGII